LRQWLGKKTTSVAPVTLWPFAALSATLDRDDPPPKAGDALPPLWHWLYFLPVERQSELDRDGHARRGGFLPPVPLARRMWAGGRIDFLQAIRCGEELTRISRIAGVNQKLGRSGPLVFVTVRHEISNAGGIAVIEEHDIVYRDRPANSDPARASQPGPAAPLWRRTIRPDDVLLFRYSALTFNAHRIHYDRRYATEEEGYPGLVVHGPLIATLLADLIRRNLPEASLSRFSFRAQSPLFDVEPFTICGEPDPGGKSVSLWAADGGGGLAMTATATLCLTGRKESAD